MTEFADLFSALEAPRTSNARRHSRHDITSWQSPLAPCSAAARPAPIWNYSATPNGNSSNPSSNWTTAYLDSIQVPGSRVCLPPSLSSSGSSALCGSLPKGNEGILAVDAKSNDITAPPWLLEMLTLRGKVVTADALHCQRQVAQQVIEQGGDYALASKGN